VRALTRVSARSIHHKRALTLYFLRMARPKLYEEKRTPTAVRIPESLHHRLQTAAAEREVSVNLLIIRAIERHLDLLAPIESELTEQSA
jgi:predicted HicB family RNase H-like nuclease